MSAWSRTADRRTWAAERDGAVLTVSRVVDGYWSAYAERDGVLLGRGDAPTRLRAQAVAERIAAGKGDR